MRLLPAIALLLALLVPGSALAFQVPIDAGDRSVYLRVGDGEFENYPWWWNGGAIRPYTSGGSPESGGAVSR